jgi:hypothetical protein
MDPTLTCTEGAVYSDGTESGSAELWKTGDTVIEVNLDTIYLIRLDYEETAGNNHAGTIQLEYNVDGAGWNPVNASSSNVRSAATANIADNAVTTDRLTVGDTQTFTAGTFDEVDGAAQGPNAGNLNNESTEMLYSVQFRSAELSGGENVEFRITTDISIGGQTTPKINVDIAAPAGAGPGPYAHRVSRRVRM